MVTDAGGLWGVHDPGSLFAFIPICHHADRFLRDVSPSAPVSLPGTPPNLVGC